jgi:hypothetical protein
MNERDRLDQLRGLRDRLERMPTSADRDWMLAQVRARAVDVETGAPAGPMRARPDDESAAEQAAARSTTTPPRTTRRRQASPAQRPRPVRLAPPGIPANPTHRARPLSAAPLMPAGPARPRAHHESVDLLEQGGVMCLDDPPAAAASASRPWCRGLRA